MKLLAWLRRIRPSRLRLLHRLRHLETQLSVLGFCSACGTVVLLAHQKIRSFEDEKGAVLTLCPWCQQRQRSANPPRLVIPGGRRG